MKAAVVAQRMMPGVVVGGIVVLVLFLFAIVGPALSSATFLLAYGQFAVIDRFGPYWTPMGSLLCLLIIYFIVTLGVAYVSTFVQSRRSRWLCCTAVWVFTEGLLLLAIVVLLKQGAIVIE